MNVDIAEHRLSFAVAPDEHLDIGLFGFFSKASLKGKEGEASVRMAARKALGWNWSNGKSLGETKAHASMEDIERADVLALRRSEFLTAIKILGALMLAGTILRKDVSKALLILDALIGKNARQSVFDSLRLEGNSLRQFAVPDEYVTPLQLPKSIFSYGATIVVDAAESLGDNVSQRVQMKVRGLPTLDTKLDPSMAKASMLYGTPIILKQVGVKA